jgi:hypothetical protein
MDDSEIPSWEPLDHLDRVYARGEQLRRRKRLLRTGLPAAAAAVLVVAGLLTLPAGSSSRVKTSSGSQGQGRAATPNGTGSASGADAVTGGDPAARATTTTRHGTQRHATAASGSGRPTAEATSSTVASAVAPTTTTSADVPACSDADLDYSTTTDRSSYAPGQSVVISLVVHNHSGHTCDGPPPCGMGPSAVVQDGNGTTVWQNSAVASMCTNPPPAPPRLAPGQSSSQRASTAWDQRGCTGKGCTPAQSPAGTYRAIARRGSVTAGPAGFTLG